MSGLRGEKMNDTEKIMKIFESDKTRIYTPKELEKEKKGESPDKKSRPPLLKVKRRTRVDKSKNSHVRVMRVKSPGNMPPPPLPLKEEIKGYDAEELRKEIEASEKIEKEKSPENLLSEVQEEKRRLEEEKAQLLRELKEKEKLIQKKGKEQKKESEVQEDEEEIPLEPKAIKSFTEERKKRK